jgi:membrane protein YdbS with pleckstrin-like domain
VSDAVTPTQFSPIEEEGLVDSLQPVAPGYRHVIRLRMLIMWLVLWVGASVADWSLLLETGFYGLPTVGVAVAGLLAVAIAPQRIHARLRYRLTGRLLRVLRGWLFHTDTVVPLVRVQHLDVVRGPLDKMFGTASLVVHTAGTHNSIVALPGLEAERAEAMRDEIREHVRTDAE